MYPRPAVALLAALALAACSDRQPATTAPGAALDVGGRRPAVGGVFISTNDAAANAVVAFDRAADGSLSYAGSYSTGGRGIGGTADPLASQFALTLSPNAQLLFVVNAGSNDVSSFAVDKGGLALVDRVPSGGVRPVSVAASGHELYVLNAGSNTVTVFRIGNGGTLSAVGASALSAGAAGAAALRLSRDGHFLSVTERVSNTIDTYVVAPDGSLGGPASNASAGTAPFGFDYTPRGQLVVSEAGSGSASSYEQARDGRLSVVSAAAPTLQRAPCWLIVDNAGRFAYTANAGSATVTGFAVDAHGALAAITPNGVTGDLGAGAQPLDLDLSRDGKFLYVFENGTGTVAAFAVRGDGSLAPMPDTPGLAPRGGYMGLAAY